MSNQTSIFRTGTLDESKPGDPLAYLSASRLKSFLTCRLRFFYEKVLGLKTPTSHNFQIGKAVHAGLEHFNMARWKDEESSPEQTLEAYSNSFRELEAQDPVDYTKKSREDCLETGHLVLSTFLSSEVASDARRILGVEAYLRKEAGILPLPLVGVLDLVVEGKSGAVPIDYKTVGATPNLEEEAWQNMLQMTAYHLLLQDATGDMPEAGELVYLTKLKNPKVIQQTLPQIDQLQVDRFKALTVSYAEGVSREEYYPSPGMQCRWCSFRGQCAQWSGSISKAA